MKKFAALLLVFALGLAGCALTGPYSTIQHIKEAVKTKDEALLAEYIDFPLLRANLKVQVRAAAIEKMGGGHGIFSALAGEAAGAVAAGLIEVAITPSGIAEVMSGEYAQLLKPASRAKGAQPPETSADDRAEAQRRSERIFRGARYAFDSTSQFSIWAQDKNGKETQFILTRDGLKWRLTNILLTELLS